MAVPIVFNKTMAAASAANIAASQSPGAGAILLNGTASNRLSTTTTAGSAVGSVNLALTSITGVVVGQAVTDSTAAALATGTVVIAITAAGVTIWPPVGGAGVGSGDTIVFAGTATIDTATATNTAIGRRVIVTSGGNDSGITFTVTGTNASGAVISDTFAGANAGAAQSNLDFVTVTNVTHTGSVATTVTVGTNGVGSSPWVPLNWHATSVMNEGFAVELVSGSANFTVQHTYDDPNNLQAGATFPIAVNNASVANAAATADGSYTFPIAAIRLLVNSGSGQLRMRVLQSSIG